MYITNLDSLKDSFKIETIVKSYHPEWDGKSKMCCPFHNEKTPSFSVSKSRNKASCFGGCQKYLDPIGFIIEKENCTFQEAVLKAAKLEGLEVKLETRKLSPEEAARRQKNQEELLSLWAMNDMVANAYFEQTYGDKVPASFGFKNGDQVRTLTKQTIERFGVCMTPDSWDFITNKFGKEQLAELGLIKEKPTGGYFDMFRNRQLFPIHSKGNRIVGFGARATEPTDKVKYLNSSESKVYKKNQLLYGLYPQVSYITKHQTIYLVEGYWDVLTPYDQGIRGIVAKSGSVLTKEQIQLMKRYAKRVVYLADNDSDKEKNAGLDAVKKDAPELVKAGLQAYVSILPEKEDPDSYCRKIGGEAFQKYIDSNMQDAFLWMIEEQWEASTKDGFAKADIQAEAIAVLVYLSNETISDYYAKEICRIAGITISSFRIELREAQNKHLTDVSIAADGSTVENTGYTAEQLKSIRNYGLFYKNRKIYCSTYEGNDTEVSNFVVNPLFHLLSKEEPKRIFEIVNTAGQRRVIDTDTTNLVSCDKFKNTVESVGNFVFSGTASHYNKLKRRVYDLMDTCYSIDTLGRHIDGFYTFGNGIFTPEGKFVEVNKYGIVAYKKKQYFLPAMSEIYKGSSNLYDEEKNFLFVAQDINFKDWAKLFCEVHGKHGQIGLCFYLAAMFRSTILETVKVPLLNLFGQPGTGKSLMAENLLGLFVKQPKGFNIHAGTKVGLFNKLMSVRDGIILLEEYKNAIHSSKIEACKSIYDNIGRERGQKTSSRNITTSTHSTAILAGQELPTADVALFTRCISLSFSKTSYTTKERNKAAALKAMRGSLSSITGVVSTHHQLVKEKFVETYKEQFTKVRNWCAEKQQPIDARMIENNAVLLAIQQVIGTVLELPFTEEDIFDACTDNMLVQHQQIGDENEVSVFFNMVEYLANSSLIREHEDFRVEYDVKLKKRILYLRFSKIYGLYMQHHRQQYNKPGINQTSLQHYLQTHRTFEGMKKVMRFGKTATSAFMFDYEKLNIALVSEPEPMRETGSEEEAEAFAKSIEEEMRHKK